MSVVILTTCGSSGKSRFGFFTVLVDSLLVGILAALAFTGGKESPIPLIGVVGVVVSAFLLTPFLTLRQNVCEVLNPLTPIGDQERISPYNIKTISSRKVMRMKKNIS